MSSILFVVNDAPYGNERAYNALRLAGSLAAKEDVHVRVFLMADAVGCAKDHQKVSSQQLCVEYLTSPTYDPFNNARAAALAQRNESCAAFQALAAAKRSADSQYSSRNMMPQGNEVIVNGHKCYSTIWGTSC